MSKFPTVRLRRLRRTDSIRELFTEVRLSKKDLIAPLFAQEGISKPLEIESLPNIYRFPVEDIVEEAKRIRDLGIKSVIVFGIPSDKDEKGSSAFAKDGVVQKAVRNIKRELGDDLVIITDVCLCQYTSHGHCGLVKDNSIDNDASIDTLAKVALSQAEAGADIVAPSAMMDGQVKAIREALDDHGFKHIPIMSYSAKYASSLYAPFRDAAHSSPAFGDRRSYQLFYTNAKEAMREIELDIEEGVDIIMIKPAISYLDLIYQAKQRFDLPLAAYSVSGEYALVKFTAKQGMIDEDQVMLEFLTSIKRAGADVIITYFAKRAAEILE
ncbi:MAG: porphobilinogen synthase [Candidatus Nitrosocaldaceae archaeon]|nr:MAG: porphobilinogen synthase [Candidatus Nitrosocaldaceae archaeon]